MISRPPQYKDLAQGDPAMSCGCPPRPLLGRELRKCGSSRVVGCQGSDLGVDRGARTELWVVAGLLTWGLPGE